MFPTSFKRALSGLCASALLVTFFVAGTPAVASAAVPTCTPTGFVRDAIDLTAARINPAGTVSGDVDATGCNIGIYYGPASHGKVSKATVHGANYFGIVNNGGHVDVVNSTIRDIGEVPFNGAQHGVAVAFVQETPGSGSITGNRIKNYQKGGIVVRGLGTTAKISDNNLSGLGPVDFIAQNGIQVSDGAKANVHENTVKGNSYTGDNLASSAGILIFGGCADYLNVMGITIDKNVLDRNDVGIYVFNADPSDSTCATASPLATNISVKDNKVSNKSVTNTSGWGAIGEAYQAGISDFGNHDSISKNKVCGIGYTPVASPPYLFFIDTTGAISPKLSGNKTTTKC